MLNKKIVGAVAGLATVASLAFSGPSAFAAESITAGGSSFAGGMLTACASAWSTDNITYTSSSSGTGRSSFNSGSFDFGAADSPYSSTDRKPVDLIYVPLVAGPIAIAFNVSGVSNLNLTATVLGDILSGKITKWNDTAIKSLNRSANLPDLNIQIVYRNTTSGTTQNFTNYLAQNGASGWKSNSSFTSAGGTTVGAHGEAASKDVVNYIAANNGTIGYADLKDTLSSNLKFAAIKNGAGQFVKPSSKTAGLFIASQSSKVANNGLVSLDYTAAVKGAYNVALVTYGLAHSSDHGAKGTAVKNFFKYVITTCAPAKALTLGYVALSGKTLKKANQLVGLIK